MAWFCVISLTEHIVTLECVILPRDVTAAGDLKVELVSASAVIFGFWQERGGLIVNEQEMLCFGCGPLWSLL